jgi:DNA-binding MarR family transcriptional regulator
VKAEIEVLVKSDFLSSILRSQVRILKVVRASAALEGLTLQQFSVLRFLMQRETVPMNALCGELMVSAPVVTGIVDRLETKGFVKREESSADRRRIEITLTDSGNKAYLRVREGYRLPLREALGSSLTHSEQETLVRLLGRFSHEIRVL